jgi:transposase
MKLSNEQRARAIGQLEAGATAAHVASHFGVNEKTIRRLRVKFATHGTVADLPRSGRPRETTLRQDRHIQLTHLRNRFAAPNDTARNTPGRNRPRISARTIRRRLKAVGIRCRRPYRGARLTPNHRRLRVAWALRHRRWRLNQWRTALFTDECKFNVDSSDRRQNVYRRSGERFTDACVIENNRWGGPSVMVWAGFTHHHKTRLVFLEYGRGRGRGLTAQRYVDQVLQPIILPFLTAHPGTILQQDNARPHSERLTQNFLAANNVQTLPWPALSPDMNPIEHVWDYMKQKIRARNLHNVHDLRDAITQEWDRLPARFLNRLVASMRKRCTELIRVNGGHTHY